MKSNNKGQKIMAKETNNLFIKLGDESLSIMHKTQMLIDILAEAKSGDEDSQKATEEVFQRLHNQSVDAEAEKKAKFLNEILDQLSLAPMRCATFIQFSSPDGSKVDHALVSMDNGEKAYVVVTEPKLKKQLKLGDRIMIDAQSKILMQPAKDQVHSGSEARLERRVDERHLEVITHQDDRQVVLAGPELMKQVDSGEVVPGRALILGLHDQIALCAMPKDETGVSHYRFLDHGAVPDVRVDRDIGSPPQVIRQVAQHVREEMLRPELRRRYRLRPCITRLLCGVSGTGKTLAIQAIHRLLYETMSEITATPLEQLPARVFRMRSSQMLSMWFGESDKNIDRLFDEVEQLADEKFVNSEGKEFRLPVMVVLEEADGMGRARGGDNVYDRVMTVVLQRLDPNRTGLSDKLVVFLSTTNEPHIVDPAFLRRIGGMVETFGRLDQEGFISILRKHIDGLPIKSGKGKSDQKTADNVTKLVSTILFDDPSDRGIVELTYQGHTEPVIKYRRDFLTGALIDRAVQQAASTAWESAIEDHEDSGITVGLLSGALSHQIISVAHQLQPENVGRYTDIPDGVRVTRVRRITQDMVSLKA
jgi:ATP-dependent 26S proteasome regulatory subunit